jgi:hypothetical protein
MKQARKISILLFFLFFSAIVFAQNTTDTTSYRVLTKDGNEYFGKITYEDSLKLILKTERMGDVSLYLADITKREVVNTKLIQKGEYWNPNPQATRYFWSPNGYGLKKGEGYYQNVWIFFNQVAVGITDNISIGAGIVPAFLFAGAPTPVWITPKVSIPVVKDKVNIGVGALVGTVLGAEDESGDSKTGFGLLYGMSTFGSRDKNVTLGLGWGYAGGEMSDKPTINLSAMIRTSRNWYLMTENYYIDTGEDEVGILSFGARRIIKRVGLDFGLFLPFSTGDTEIVALPWLGISVPFGK